MGGHKTLTSRRGVSFLGKGSKDLPGKWKLQNLDYIHITLKLCKIYAYSENISKKTKKTKKSGNIKFVT